jgi:hypothetical protein
MLRIEGVLWVGLVGAALLGGCSNDGGQPCLAPTNCPAITSASSVAIVVPTGLPSPLVEVAGDSNCIVLLVDVPDAGDSFQPIQVQELLLTQGQPATCLVRGTLADGTEVAGTVTFQPVTNGCCPGFKAVAGPFGPVDAGADAR